MKRFLLYKLGCVIVLLIISCGRWEAKDVIDEWPEMFPDYVEVTVPHTIAPLNFEVKGATYLQAILTNATGCMLRAEGEGVICVDPDKWHALLCEGGDILVQVSAWTDKHPEGVRYRDFIIHVSCDEIDPWIMYRLLPPGYEGWNRMSICQRNLNTFEERVLMDNTMNGKGCINCHAVAQYMPDNFMFHSRGEMEGTFVFHDGKWDKADMKMLTGGKHGSHNAWHPGGKFIAFSSNSTKQIFYGRSQDKIEVFDAWSDLFIYDVKNCQVISDERFCHEQQWETFPSFSPDGRWLYFSVANPVHMPEGLDSLHYDLVRCPFDDTLGQLGEVDTVYSSSKQGGTALMPRVSPDGKYVLYTVSQNGAFNLYHKESNFEMVSTDSSMAVPMQIDCSAINSDEAESYHVWSSNGRWMMFSSKRVDGRYTRLFIAHFDGQRWSKPFMLPQEDPRQNTLLMMAYNVAEFLKRPFEEELPF